MQTDDIEQEIQRQAESEAGKELARYGFKATHNGGGIVNFARTAPGGGQEYVMTDLSQDGYGPLALAEPVVRMDADLNETHFPSLSAFLATLPSPWLSERLISRLSPLRRANLERRIDDHLSDAEHGCNAMGVVVTPGHQTEHVERLTRMAGRVAMLISNAELRERSGRHG